MRLPVRQIEHAVGDARGMAALVDIAEPRRDERQRAVDGKVKLDHGRAEDLEAGRQRGGVEEQRQAVVDLLVAVEVAYGVGAPGAGGTAVVLPRAVAERRFRLGCRGQPSRIEV